MKQERTCRASTRKRVREDWLFVLLNVDLDEKKNDCEICVESTRGL